MRPSGSTGKLKVFSKISIMKNLMKLTNGKINDVGGYKAISVLVNNHLRTYSNNKKIWNRVGPPAIVQLRVQRRCHTESYTCIHVLPVNF